MEALVLEFDGADFAAGEGAREVGVEVGDLKTATPPEDLVAAATEMP